MNKVRGKFDKDIGTIDMNLYWEENLYYDIIEKALVGLLNNTMKEAAEIGACAQILPSGDDQSALTISVDLPFGPDDDEPTWSFEFKELLEVLLRDRPGEIDAQAIHAQLQECVGMVKKFIDESESREEKPIA